jgi:hypothetical protein
MIAVPGGARVWLATGHTDMRNYAERSVMRSPRWENEQRRRFSVGTAQHNITNGGAALALQ